MAPPKVVRNIEEFTPAELLPLIEHQADAQHWECGGGCGRDWVGLLPHEWATAVEDDGIVYAEWGDNGSERRAVMCGLCFVFDGFLVGDDAPSGWVLVPTDDTEPDNDDWFSADDWREITNG